MNDNDLENYVNRAIRERSKIPPDESSSSEVSDLGSWLDLFVLWLKGMAIGIGAYSLIVVIILCVGVGLTLKAFLSSLLYILPIIIGTGLYLGIGKLSFHFPSFE